MKNKLSLCLRVVRVFCGINMAISMISMIVFALVAEPGIDALIASTSCGLYALFNGWVADMLAEAQWHWECRRKK